MAEIADLTLAQLASGLQRKEFSSVELTKQYLQRIERYRELNAFLEVCGEAALQAAAQCDERLKRGDNNGALLGVPIAIKDMIVTQGVRTTCASKILANFIPPYDATVIRKIKAAGGFVLGKTNMDEFAMGSSTENSAFGTAKNPWNKERVPGGSSGGSAVAVAARLSPVSLGTDTGGSVRQPASLCSLVGLKPTYGRVSRYGVVAFASSLDQVGTFARDVRDCAIITQVIAGHDPNDSTSVDMPVPNFQAVLGLDIKGLKLGIPKEYFVEGVNAEVKLAVQNAISKLKDLGAEVVEISLPHTEVALSVYYIIAPAEASSNLARYDGVRYGHRAAGVSELREMYFRTRSEGFGREVKRRIMIGTYVLSSGYYDAYYLRAQKVRTLVAQDFKLAFDTKCDVIVCPTSPTTAFKLGEKVTDPLSMYLNDIFTIPVNLAGLPGMSIPCGFDSTGLPIGLQLIGKAWDEESLFRVAFAYEASTDWHKKIPPL